MESLRLNNAPASLFETNGSARSDIIACGRLLMYESAGREMNRVRVNAGMNKHDYALHLSDVDYKQTSGNHQRDLMLYCAKICCNNLGKDAPASYEEFMRMQRDYMRDPNFLRVLSGIVQEIIRPMLPFVMSDIIGKLAQTVSVPMGQTYEVNVGSGEIIVFQDSSWGASRSVPYSELYDKTFTLNPTPRSAGFYIKWYQLVSNDRDIGQFYNSIASGYSSFVMGLFSKSLSVAVSDTTLNPAYLQFNSYNTANWINAQKYVRMVNGAKGVQAFGDYSALAKLLPSGTAQDAALTMLLGDEWNRQGYLGTVMGVPCFAFDNCLVPNTQYTTGTQLMSTSTVYLTATNQPAPVWIAFEDGTPITVELDASDGTGDGSIFVNVTASVDCRAIVSSKIATISNV